MVLVFGGASVLQLNYTVLLHLFVLSGLFTLMASASNPDDGQFGNAGTSYLPGQMPSNQPTDGFYPPQTASMASASNPDDGQFGNAGTSYPPGQMPSNQPIDGFYPPQRVSYAVAPTFLSYPQNSLFTPTAYQGRMSQHYAFVHTAQPVIVTTQPYVPVKESYACHIAFACIVFWFCGWLFGGIAFILAMIARGTSHHQDAKRLGQASLALSIIGLILGLVLWGFIIWFIVVSVTASGSGSCYYTCAGYCYNYQSYGYTSTQCYNYFTSSCYSSSTGYCYYNY